MVIIKMVFSKEISIFDELQTLKSLLKKKNIIIGIVESYQGTNTIIKIVCEDSENINSVKKYINFYIGNIIYNIVIERYKQKELYQFLSDNYFFLRQEELLEAEEIMRALNRNNTFKDEMLLYFTNKTNIIIESIVKCIEENSEINIDGFLTFRSKQFREDIEEIIDKVIERYIVEKEYNEFIKLLRYFVEIQENKLECINILVSEDGTYRVTDDNDKDMFETFKSELSVTENIEANAEDIIISGLITFVPKKIIVHKIENSGSKEFFETIKNVFGERYSICSGCERCIKSSVKNVDTLIKT